MCSSDLSRVRLAIARGDIAVVEELAYDEDWLQRQTWFTLPASATRLDALAVVGSVADVEQAAGRVGRPGSYLHAFALRALGIVRDDEELLGRAEEAFRAMRVTGHAAQTETLRRLRRRARG